MFKLIFNSVYVLIVSVFTMLATGAFAAPPQVNVNCDMGGPTALQKGVDGARVNATVKVTGDCTGANVIIAKDGLILSGDGTATVTAGNAGAAITIAGATRVTLEGFALIHGSDNFAIRVIEGGAAIVRGISLITGEDGVVVSGGFLEVNNSNVSGANDDGIVAVQNATLLLIETDVSGNGDDGVIAASNSAVHFNGGNSVNNNGGDGLVVAKGNAQFDGTNTIQDNGPFDINCFGFSRVLVFSSITSSTRDSRARDCVVAQAGGPLFVSPMPSAEPYPFNLVDCSPPGTVNDDSISAAIANGLTFIRVRGMCEENVFITSNSHIVIRGESGLAADDGLMGGGVHVVGPQRVFLGELKITGGEVGVTAYGGADVEVVNSVLTPSDTGGSVFALHNSSVRLENVTANKFGIFVAGSSSLIAEQTTVDTDFAGGPFGPFAISINSSSSAQISNSTLTGFLNMESSYVLISDTVIESHPFVLEKMRCKKFSSIEKIGFLRDENGVDLTPADVVMDEIIAGTPDCVLDGF